MTCRVAGHSPENVALPSPRSTIDSQRENTRVASLRNQLRKVLESVAATRLQIETIRQREGLLAIQSSRVIREAVAPSIGHSEQDDMPFTEVQIREPGGKIRTFRLPDEFQNENSPPQLQVYIDDEIELQNVASLCFNELNGRLYWGKHQENLRVPPRQGYWLVGGIAFLCSHSATSLNLAFAGAKAANGQRNNKDVAANGQWTSKDMVANGQQKNKELRQCTHEGCFRFFTLRNFRQHRSKCQKMKPRMRRLETEVANAKSSLRHWQSRLERLNWMLKLAAPAPTVTHPEEGTPAMRVRERQERSLKYGQEVIVHQPEAMSVAPDYALKLKKRIPKGSDPDVDFGVCRSD